MSNHDSDPSEFSQLFLRDDQKQKIDTIMVLLKQMFDFDDSHLRNLIHHSIAKWQIENRLKIQEIDQLSSTEIVVHQRKIAENAFKLVSQDLDSVCVQILRGLMESQLKSEMSELLNKNPLG